MCERTVQRRSALSEPSIRVRGRWNLSPIVAEWVVWTVLVNWSCRLCHL